MWCSRTLGTEELWTLWDSAVALRRKSWRVAMLRWCSRRGEDTGTRGLWQWMELLLCSWFPYRLELENRSEKVQSTVADVGSRCGLGEQMEVIRSLIANSFSEKGSPEAKVWFATGWRSSQETQHCVLKWVFGFELHSKCMHANYIVNTCMWTT